MPTTLILTEDWSTGWPTARWALTTVGTPGGGTNNFENFGYMSTNGANADSARRALLHYSVADLADAEVLVQFRRPDFSDTASIVLRRTGGTDEVRLDIVGGQNVANPDKYQLVERVGGADNVLATLTQDIPSNTAMTWVRFRAEGDALTAHVWPASGSESSTPSLAATTAVVGSGQAGLEIRTGASAMAWDMRWDDYSLYEVTAPPPPPAPAQPFVARFGAVRAQRTVVSAIIADGAITAEKIRAWAVQANHLDANSVTAGAIEAGAITTEHLSASVVTAEKIAAGAITAVKIAAGSVTADKIAAGAITADKIAARNISASHIVSGTITGNEISARTLVASHISAGTLTGNEIAANAIVAGHIQAGNITAGKIAANAVGADEIVGNAILGGHISGGAIDGKTITGAFIRTAASGVRVELSSTYYNKIHFYPNNGETTPADIRVGETAADRFIQIYSQDYGSGRSHISVGAGISGQSYHEIDLVAPGGYLYFSGYQATVANSTRFVAQGGTFLEGAPSVSATANVYMASDAQICKITSSARFKRNVAPVTADPTTLLSLTPKHWQGLEGSPDDHVVWTGFIAEDVEVAYPPAAVYDEAGLVENYNDRALTAGLLALVKTMDERIAALEAAQP